MINIDDRLIREDLTRIGVDAFAILMCITSHLGKSSTAWPGHSRLRALTGLSKQRTYKAIIALIEAGMVERKQENDKGKWGRVVYRVTTNYIGIYMGASGFSLSEPLAGNAEYGYPEYANPSDVNPAHISIKEGEVLTSKEVLTKEEERNAPAKNEKTETPKQPTQTPPPDSAPPPSPKQVGARNAPTADQMGDYLEELYLQPKWQGRFVCEPRETAENIHDHYTANGWKVGRNPMKDWEAACRNWLKNNRTYAKQHRTNVSSTPRQTEVISEEAQRQAHAITLAELGITGGDG